MIQKAVALLFSVTLIFGLATTTHVVTAKAKVTTYSSCKALNKDYKGGVARSSSSKNKGGKTKFKPFVSKELYDANKKSDRDKDLIACER